MATQMVVVIRSEFSNIGQNTASHPSHTHSRSPGRAGSTNPRTHLSHPEAIQVPREQRLPVRRQGSEPWSLRRRPVRIPPIQAVERSGRAKSMLRCAEIHHGERCQGLRGRRLWQAPCCSCEEHEIHCKAPHTHKNTHLSGARQRNVSRM